ncbi:unnamed protein product [Echinostoma caproni]|uniref:ADP/ATP translocase n=1 Tax=Echinostoma caproni TaxID=27848 RepID=A0A183BEN6_9TREM|nr:unnamed protein product [Echinostoma caproni]
MENRKKLHTRRRVGPQTEPAITRTHYRRRPLYFSMLKKRVFVPLSGLGSFTVQTLLYPLVLLRIRLQLQEGVQVYRGLIHATSCIIREEGFRGLYNGYFVKSAQIVSGKCFLLLLFPLKTINPTIAKNYGSVIKTSCLISVSDFLWVMDHDMKAACHQIWAAV